MPVIYRWSTKGSAAGLVRMRSCPRKRGGWLTLTGQGAARGGSKENNEGTVRWADGRRWLCGSSWGAC